MNQEKCKEMMSQMSGGTEMSNMMNQMMQNMGNDMPLMMTKMMPMCAGMMLPKLEKEKQIEFVVNMIDTFVTILTEGMDEKEKKELLQKLFSKYL